MYLLYIFLYQSRRLVNKFTSHGEIDMLLNIAKTLYHITRSII